MTLHEARLIREFKRGCTYRRLAEIYYPESHDGHGNQGYGEDLCREALALLYPDKECLWQLGPIRKSKKFDRENKSRLGDFYWWE